MPVWAQLVVGIAALAAAVIYIWQKVAKPVARGITTMDKLLPVAVELADLFHDVPGALETLREIAVQFKPDSGSSLFDVIQRLDRAAQANTSAVDVLQTNMETARRLAEQDRELAEEDRLKLASLIAKLNDAAAGRVVIADNLEAAHERAESEPAGSDPGAASDAAARRPDDE